MELADIVAQVLEVDRHEVTDDAGPDRLSSWTSMRHIQIVVALEEAYQVSLSYEEIRDLKTVGGLRTMLRAKGVKP